MADMFEGTGWGPSLVLILGVVLILGMVWVAAHSDRFKQVVREEEGLDDDDLPQDKQAP
jgi:hypothetical protein